MCQNLNKKEEVGGHAVGATSISRSQGSHALNQTLLYQPFYSGTWVHKLCSEGLFLISSHAIRLFFETSGHGFKHFCTGFIFQTQELCPYFRHSVAPAQSVNGQHLDVLGSHLENWRGGKNLKFSHGLTSRSY